MSSATGEARKMQGKVKTEYKKNEKTNNTEYVKNQIENPAYNSGHVSCTTKEWPEYPDQPRH